MVNNKLYDENYRNVMAEYFFYLRKDSGKTYETVAKAIGVLPNTFYNYEKAKRDMPMSVIVNLCEHFGKNYVEVMEYVNKRATEITLRQQTNEEQI